MDPSLRMKQLTEASKTLSVDPKFPIRLYFRSGKEMLRMATIYKDEGFHEKAFILYMKYITLFVEKLRAHPQFKEASASDKKLVKEKCAEVFPIAEELKTIIKRKYEEEYKQWLIEKRQKEEKEREMLLKFEKENELKKQRKEALEKEQIMMKFQEAKERFATNDLTPSAPVAEEIESEGFAEVIANNSRKDSTPSIDRSTKPSHLLSFSHDDKLRKISIPSSLVQKFLLVAQFNTSKNIETCGILAGKLSQNCFTITHVLIPSQQGTSDSCQTAKEEVVFAYQDENDLMTLGWIHTHPSQSAFMSSIDLHTHCSYQLMMSEAIAIVCAPKFDQVGIFSLTPNYGLNFISKCTETGFHPHPSEPTIYEESKHIIFDNKPVEVVDLR
ncbi:STAM-binding protein-like protein [Leptotrombidium deliense]|uniref:STAM-binding protein-like protein n=1 Tax=Leptotrombidium deliense TaxID=299467 RepID=A0A443SS75_9ACAR|nr:STAM-binding protein-like protein [Leptotrombidium deliense]